MGRAMRDSMEFDVVIVGAGPAGLAAAIRLKQQAQAANLELSVCVLEKAAEIGAHSLSGAVMDPIALNELLPDWRERQAPVKTAVTDDRFLLLSDTSSWQIPGALLPPVMHNPDCYVISLGELCRWLGEQAESLGVEIYPGFAAADLLYDEDGAVKGVISGDMGRHKDGSEKPEFALGMELHARYTLFAEGARGSLTKMLEQRFQLRAQAEPAKFGLGFKELWRVPADQHQPGLILHSQGWPLDAATGGGGFLYHLDNQLVSVGFVVHLNYQNPYLSPFDEFQRYKTHPAIARYLQGGERLSYGARTISEGGIQSLPELVFPGGALIGCAAGMVNVPRIKGIHNALKSGMLAAEAVVEAIQQNRAQDRLDAYPQALKASWLWHNLYQVRNVKPALSKLGTWFGTLYAGLDLWLGCLGLKLPWTFKQGQADHQSLLPASQCQPIAYPKPDGQLSFDRLSSVYLANLAHEDDQPVHLQLLDTDKAISLNWQQYRSPEQRYCPAGVYEILDPETAPKLQINSGNCVHCKACDIKDPGQNIRWVPPEGGSGPIYSRM